MIRDLLRRLIVQAIEKAQRRGDLPTFEIPSITVEHPKQASMGDYATSAAMQLARAVRLPPPQIAQTIAAHLELGDMATAEVVSGYINFRLTAAFLSRQVDAIIAASEHWGDIDLGQGQSVQVEHGSANPTGPLTVAAGRNVVIGDTLANVLEAAGYQVHREWYVNDAGNQIRHFGASVYARYMQLLGHDTPFPEDGYRGDYVIDIAKQIIAREGDRYAGLPRDEARRALGQLGIDAMMDSVRASLARIGVRYDNFFSERSLYESGLFERVLPILREKGLLIEHDGALWFSEDGSPIADAGTPIADLDDSAKSKLQNQKSKVVQAVVIRSPKVIADPAERPTYFASDIAYVWNKLVERGFDRAIYVWGEDHQGDVPRLIAATKALGLDPSRITLLIYRFITLMRGGQEVRMGKRAGNIVTLDDVVDEVGADATRYVLLSRSIDTKIVFDLDVVKQQSEDNPVFYPQYAHARICSIFRKAAEQEESARAGEQTYEHPSELNLIRKLLELPEVIELVAATLQPHHLTVYVQSLATTFNAFYRDCRIIGEAPAVYARRMKLARASQIGLARVLRLMGMSAPERM
ncbi:MAG: arginine--tRNA ligase [Anaerolineae bacterium]|nr:arginine--tRNA ligase [Thermoflexales bacterium]MDW8408263.1 arginine--tRNA ligase [Anaerolineae bacterium]